jgi:hypothetical protein
VGGRQSLAQRRAQGLVLQRDGHRGEAVLNFTVDDVGYLTSDEGVAALAQVGELPLTDLVADVAAVRARHGEHAPALVETTLLRRRARAKLAGTDGWLFTDDAVQQATATAVARHRAQRLMGRTVHDATCSIGTELAVLREAAGELIGSDIDPVRLAMARHNLGSGVPLCRADALHPITTGAVVVIDPARRSGGARRFDPRAYTPPLDQVLQVYRDRDLVVKCAPGVDFAAVAELGFDGEIEVTSLGGSVREACLWSPGLAEPGIRRRATVLDTAEQLTDADPGECPAAAAGRWIVDPDGAVVRAGLVRQYAARHRLWQLDPDIAYLTGDVLPEGVRGFEVIEELPFTEKKLRQVLSGLDCGTLEILVRGVGVDPDALRRRLRPRGRRALSVVITRIGTGHHSRATAFVCKPSR